MRDIRISPQSIQIRAVDNDDNVMRLAGQVMTFGRESLPLHARGIGCEFVEIIDPDVQIDHWNDEVKALVNHDWHRVIGSLQSGTLRLDRKTDGLYAEIDLPETTYGRDLYESVKRGDIRGMSFGFGTPKGGSSWDHRRNPILHTIRHMEIDEISVTPRPAYPDTSIATRSLEDSINEHLSEYERRIREMSAKIEMGGYDE